MEAHPYKRELKTLPKDEGLSHSEVVQEREKRGVWSGALERTLRRLNPGKELVSGSQ